MGISASEVFDINSVLCLTSADLTTLYFMRLGIIHWKAKENYEIDKSCVRINENLLVKMKGFLPSPIAL